jgi:hypothetical protein
MRVAMLNFHQALFVCTLAATFVIGAINEGRKDQLNTFIQMQIISMSLAQLSEISVI